MEERQFSVHAFSPKFHDMLFDYYIPDPDDEKLYVTEIGGVKLGFGSKYMLNKVIHKKLPAVYPSGAIPRSQVISKPLPQVSDPVVRRLGHIHKKYEVKEVGTNAVPQKNIPSREGQADLYDGDTLKQPKPTGLLP